MKYKMLFAAAAIAASANASATKVAEYGDPVIGNDYNDCEFEKVYGTGGAGYLYDEYEITCPSYGTYEVGVYTAITPISWGQDWTSCTFYPGDDSYYVSGNCDNWRVYLND
ncbi:hypothetical protein [Marinimicrobium agarilyticum]|uniref:hypothetical protein n=1 Tax=Marinimicrobium agarilyticum TaxID=306546 RepID=UPI0004140764|nr:hypothetical protein [Marinimicrobium agarilyticum]